MVVTTDRMIGEPNPASFHLVDGHGYLFARMSQRVFGLNETATFICCCLEEGMTPAEAAEALAASFELPVVRARWDVSQMLETLDGLGAAAPAAHSTSPIVPGAVDQEPVAERRYGVLGVGVHIRWAIPPVDAMRDAWAHLEDPHSAPDVVLTVAESDGRTGIVEDGGWIVRDVPPGTLVPQLTSQVLERVYTLANPWLGLHAASVVGPRGAVVLPGRTGSGKSTLAAALVHEGLVCYGDDATLVREGGVVVPASLPIWIKEGSWPVLHGLFAEKLASLDVHVGPDDQRMRYLCPSPPVAGALPDVSVTAMIFPCYDASVGCTIVEPVGVRDTLGELNRAGYLPGEPLDGQGFDALLSWLDGLPRLRLTYGRLAPAVSAICSYTGRCEAAPTPRRQ